MNEILRCGMVGGGMDSLIGDVQRKAAVFDGKVKLVAGCFSRSYSNTLLLGQKLDLNPERLYKNYQEMAEKETEREDKIDFVIIVTPNNTHFEIAKAFLERGVHVVCDKPFTLEVEEAEKLASLARKKDLLNCITYTYSGYPMVKQAREIVKNGEIGKIRMVMGEYLQEWLAMPVERSGNKQASWRLDPVYSGEANCVADIGSHIENTVSYITGLEIESLCANLDKFVKGRVLDDNAEVLIKYAGGARGRDAMLPLAFRVSRLPGGHPEGFFEAFANIYSNFSDSLVAKKAGKTRQELNDNDFPTFEEGLKGVRFIHQCVESSQQGAVWVSDIGKN